MVVSISSYHDSLLTLFPSFGPLVLLSAFYSYALASHLQYFHLYLLEYPGSQETVLENDYFQLRKYCRILEDRGSDMSYQEQRAPPTFG